MKRSEDPRFKDWSISGRRGLLVMGYDPGCYPANERVVVVQVNPAGEATPEAEQEWAKEIAALPATLAERDALKAENEEFRERLRKLGVMSGLFNPEDGYKLDCHERFRRALYHTLRIDIKDDDAAMCEIEKLREAARLLKRYVEEMGSERPVVLVRGGAPFGEMRQWLRDNADLVASLGES